MVPVMTPAVLMLRPDGRPVALNEFGSAFALVMVRSTTSPSVLVWGPGLVIDNGACFTVQLNWMLPAAPSCVALMIAV